MSELIQIDNVVEAQSDAEMIAPLFCDRCDAPVSDCCGVCPDCCGCICLEEEEPEESWDNRYGL